MAMLRFTLLALAITLAAGKKKGSTAVSVDVNELRELLVSSMQTTISLTALVEQQTQRVSEILKFVDAAKEDIEAVKSKVQAVASDDADRKLIEELEDKLGSEILAVKDVADAAKEDIEAVKSKVQAVASDDADRKLIEELEEKLGIEIQAVKESIPEEKPEKDVIIVSGEEKLRDPNCARVCAGTTIRKNTNWEDYSDNGLYTDVDISKCGFVTVPTITTSLEGSSRHWSTTGSSEIYDVTTSTFRIYLLTSHGRGGGANSRNWNMEWIAVGYTC